MLVAHSELQVLVVDSAASLIVISREVHLLVATAAAV